MANTDALRVPVVARPADDPSIALRLQRIWETRAGWIGALASVDHKAIGKRYLVTVVRLPDPRRPRGAGDARCSWRSRIRPC